RIEGMLARTGDAGAAESVSRRARDVAPPEPPRAATTPGGPGTPPEAAPRPPRGGRSSEKCEGDDDVQSAALNALQQMDSEKALPILRRVLARRDAGSECLRRKAVFIVSQQQGRESEQILLDAARNDPDSGVREQAVWWLSQVNSPTAVAALDSI